MEPNAVGIARSAWEEDLTSLSLVAWREDRAHIAPVTDIIDSISRARSSVRLVRSQSHEHARTTDEQRSLLGFVITSPFEPFASPGYEKGLKIHSKAWLEKRHK